MSKCRMDRETHGPERDGDIPKVLVWLRLWARTEEDQSCLINGPCSILASNVVRWPSSQQVLKAWLSLAPACFCSLFWEPLSSSFSIPATALSLSTPRTLFPSGLKTSAYNVLAILLAPTSSDLSFGVPSSGKVGWHESGLLFYRFIVPFNCLS